MKSEKEDNIHLSCDKQQCDGVGNNAIWIEDVYFLWLCTEHYKEYKKNHKDYLKEKKK